MNAKKRTCLALLITMNERFRRLLDKKAPTSLDHIVNYGYIRIIKLIRRE